MSTAEQVCTCCDKFAHAVNKFARTINKIARTVNQFLRKSICFCPEVKSFLANKNVSASSSYFRGALTKLKCIKNNSTLKYIYGPVRQSEIKYFVPVYFPILDRCHELLKSARIFYNITVRKPLFAS